MNILTVVCRKIPNRWIGEVAKRTISSKGTLIAEQLAGRSIIRLRGKEVVPYLQGLITNDMAHLERGAKAMYAMILNNTGRVLYDTIIYRTNDQDVYYIECDKSILIDLKRHLRLFRVRRKIEINSVGGDFSPWVVFQEEAISGLQEAHRKPEIVLELDTNIGLKDVLVSKDPRLRALGYRVLMPKSYTSSEISKLFSWPNIADATPGKNYKYLRYSLGIGEGVEDHPPNKCFPLEANCDFLHGVSFHKGCYIGQELTARVHHTGVIRKRLMPIKLTKKAEYGSRTIQSIAGTVVGTLRGITNDAGLGLLRVEHALKMPSLYIDGEACKIMVPDWWPKELPIRHMVKETS